jgi:predicted nuclease of restriction endonuclease-like (RecB) superfamily
MNEIPNDLRSAVKAIKAAILQKQYKAAQSVNKEQLSLYFGVGCYVSQHSRNGFWGEGAIESISEQLQKELPGLRGFSATSIKNMRQFYEEWVGVIRPPMAGELESSKNRPPLAGDSEVVDCSALLQQYQPPTGCFDMNEFVGIGFSHHMEILNKTKKLDERLFYIHQTYINQWNKYHLRDMLKNDLYHHAGEMPNNFAQTIPSTRTALQAIEMFKDEYLLDFINVEELGERDKADVDERVVENAIVHNVKNFIMTFGHDFAFVGNQYHLEKYGHDVYPDLLFYNRELAALVAVELKKGEFKPAYLGQLSAYLRILDSEVKKPFENPSIGIVLCKQADKSFVEFLIQGYDNPMGVATYKTTEEVRKVLPSEEDLRKIMDDEI